MIAILHGDDVSRSRDYFHELKQKHKEAVLLDGNKLTITDLVQNIEGSGLFNDTKTIFIENFLTKVKKTERTAKDILSFIVNNSKKSTFVLWEPKEISKKDLIFLKDAVIKMFKLPKNIFLFLDNLRPNNSKNMLHLFHQALDNGIKEELILFMMQRQIRLFLTLCSPNALAEGSQIDEISRLAPWQMEKLEKQMSCFDESSLKKIYKKLYEIEIGQKSGSLPLSLTQSIDFLLLEI